MAFDSTALTAYIEDKDFPLLSTAQAKAVTANLVTIQVGIKESSNLQFLDTDVVFQDGDNCTRSASGTTTFTKKNIAVGAVTISEDLCVKKLNGYWMQQMVAQGAAGDTVMPGDIEGAWLENKAAILMKQIEVADWQGDTGSGTNNLSYYDGLLKQIDAGSPIDGNPTGITVATGILVTTIIGILQGMYLLIPENIDDKDDLTIFIGKDNYKLYVNAMINANLFHFVGEDGMAKLHGTDISIVPTVGLSGTDRIIACSASNLVIGMDGDDAEDFNVRLDPVAEKSILFDAEFKRGTQVFYDDEVVEFTLVP